MLKQEIQFLIKKHKKEGMNPNTVLDRIEELIISQQGFKNMKEENNKLDKKTEKLEKKITSLENEIRKKNKQIFDLKHQINTSKQEKETRNNGLTTANTHQLKRILCFLEEENKPLNKNTIFKSCGMSSNNGNSAINFLANHNLIKYKDGYYSK